MRVISLVPSLTETLLESGVEVVGRTRFCVHPSSQVQAIPIVGGTKDMNLALIKKLQPDLVILDREENKKEMADALPFPLHATHVEDHQSLSFELRRLDQLLARPVLCRWADVAEECRLNPRVWDWSAIPGELSRLDSKTQAKTQAKDTPFQKIVYVIWKNPWMAVSKKTFIGSTLSILGAQELLAESEEKYFTFDWEKESQNPDHFFLYSSEPYPFHKKPPAASVSGSSIVDGEAYSWFGIRNLRFLARALNLKCDLSSS